MTSCIQGGYKGAALVSESEAKSERYISGMKQAFKVELVQRNRRFWF